MLKNFRDFIKESVENRGIGPTNNQLIPNPTPKSTLNSSLTSMDTLRIGKQVCGGKIDGFLEKVEKNGVLVKDRLTGEIIAYRMKDFMKEISKSSKPKDVKKIKYDESVKIQQIKTIENEEDEEDELEKQINESYDEEIEDITDYDEDLVGDVYSPGRKKDFEDEFVTQDEKELEKPVVWSDEEEDEEEISRPQMRYGTEDNPTGEIGKNPIEENWKSFWEKYAEEQFKLIKENVEDIEDLDIEYYKNDDIDGEVETFEEEDEEDDDIDGKGIGNVFNEIDPYLDFDEEEDESKEKITKFIDYNKEFGDESIPTEFS